MARDGVRSSVAKAAAATVGVAIVVILGVAPEPAVATAGGASDVAEVHGSRVSPAAAAAPEAAADWKQVSAGGSHTCAVTTSGRLYCWGSDLRGQLGDGGDNADETTPAEVSGGSTDWAAVAAGNSHTCAVKRSGRLYCWGYDNWGQLGDGSVIADQPVPVQVGTSTDWASVAAGDNHTCALATSGHLFCWGDNLFGQVGDNHSGGGGQTTPAEVFGGASNWASVAAGGEHTCARKTSGRLFCWGWDYDGQLGDGGTNTSSKVPVQVAGTTTDWTSVTLGLDHTCGRRTSGQLFCWGHDGYGDLGNGAADDADQPVPAYVSGLATNWVSVSAGRHHTCAVKTSGRLYCWGWDVYGKLGDGPPHVDQPAPVQVSGAATDWAAVDAGEHHTCALKTSGRLFCWGEDDAGQLGDGGTNSSQDVPIPVGGVSSNWKQVSAGDTHTCAVSTTGRLFCWGDDERGALGDGGANTAQATPVEVAGAATDWASVAAGRGHTCARKTSGRLFCWGDDRDGALGDGGTNTDQPTPVEVAGGATDWASVSAGADHTCARKTSRRLYCWGSHSSGQLGNGDQIGAVHFRTTPQQVWGGATDWYSVEAGMYHTCALKTSGRLYCWGNDVVGSLGNGGDDVNRAKPVEVYGAATDWASVSAGMTNTCALKTTGRLYCWGADDVGQLGNDPSPSPSATTPVPVAGGATNWVSVVTAVYHSCALKESGRVYCWGRDIFGEVGDGGGNVPHYVPVQVYGAATDWAAISASGYHTCARTTGRRLYCWGLAYYGELGNGGSGEGSDQSTPVPVV